MRDDEDDLDRERRATRILREARDTVRRLKDDPANARRDEIEKLPPADLAKTLIPAPEDSSRSGSARPTNSQRRARRQKKN